MFGWLKKLFTSSIKVPLVPTDTSGGVYSGLRSRAFSMRSSDVGITSSKAQTAWGILMETGYPGATATLLALNDGTTSLYLSSGGGVIGAHSHETVRIANSQFLDVANLNIQHMKPTLSFPVPAMGETIFYVLTDGGTLTACAPEQELGNNRNVLSPLFYAGHEVITQLRLVSNMN